jgi:hypothetical protein
VKFEFELESNSNSETTFSSHLISKLPSRWTRLISPSYSIQPAQPVHLSSPVKPRHHLTHSISVAWGPHVRAPFFTNPTWSPEPALRRRSHRNSAREEGAAGPPSRHARRAGAHP